MARTRAALPHLTRRKLTSRITIPDNVSPHVKLVFSEMQRQAFRYEDASDGAGVLVPTIKAWRRKNRPSLESLEAVLGWLGWDLAAVPRAGVLPAEFEADLKVIADKHGMTIERTRSALVEVITSIHERFPFLREAPPRRKAVISRGRRKERVVHPDQFSLIGDAVDA